MEVSGQLHAQTDLFQKKELAVGTDRKLVGPWRESGRFREGKHVLPLPELKPLASETALGVRGT